MGLQAYAELFGKRTLNARFGTAIANAGDLNQDGYNDVAIGAPYEDNNGVVYIYHGSRYGIVVNYVQRISAAEISPSLSGFGIHISRGVDIDSNLYPDLLIGAYASSNALLFKTKPVIQVSAKISFSPKQINNTETRCSFQGRDHACVNVTTCLLYAGKHVPPHLDFQHEILVEPSSQVNLVTPRGFFVNGDKSNTQVLQKSRLYGGRDNCIVKELLIQKDIKDVISPVQLLYRYSLITPSGEAKLFNGSFPVIDALSPANITSLVAFQTGCGEDNKCLSYLSTNIIVMGSLDDPLVIGENTTLNLVIEVVNKGEPAYMSELRIYLPSYMPSKNQDFCSSANVDQGNTNNASLLCDLGNPLISYQKILLKLDLTKIPTYKKQDSITFEALTASTETNQTDNKKTLPLQFKAIADIGITGSPSHEQISYGGKADEKTSVLITHTYFVMNHGPSPVEVIDIVFRIPMSLKKSNGEDFVILRSLEIESGKQSVSAECNNIDIDIKPIVTGTKKKTDGIFGEDDLVIHNENSSKPLSEVFSRSKRSSDSKSTRKKNIIINCDTAKCKKIKCWATQFLETKKFAKISFSLQVNMDILNKYADPWYSIDFITSGEVTWRKDKSEVILKDYHPDIRQVKTILVSLAPPETEEVAQWIIFVSIGIGILLLLIILALLVKFGFFKREQRAKMEALKSKGELNDYNPMANENTESEVTN